MSTITVMLRIFPEKRKEFLQAVSVIHEDIKGQQGFTKSTVFQEVNDPDYFRLTEEWDTQADLDMFTKSDTFRALMGALKVLSRETEIHYHLKNTGKDLKGPEE